MDAACVACQRRGMPCFGQEFVDVPLDDLEGEKTVVERLKRAEILLDTISRDISSDKSSSSASTRQSLEKEVVPEATELRVDDDASDNVSGVVLDAQIPLQQQTKVDVFGGHIQHLEISKALHHRLPSQEDASLIIGRGMAIVFVQGICNHYGEKLQPTSVLSALPPATAHPVLLARKFLQLSLCIQRLDPSLSEGVLYLGQSPADAMWMYFNLASNTVTCHEELLDSIEGVECLLYQSVYLMNSGNLRRALVSLRRASTLAQFMGLDRAAPYEVKQYDPTTNVSCAVLWARISHLERYLSLFLGMPSAIPRALASGAPGGSSADLFEMQQTAILERMIERSQERNYHDLALTQDIDRDLNKAASVMSAKWWAPLDLSQSTSSKDILVKVISAQLQIMHYNLLTILHLPYLQWDATDDRFNYSKVTCVYASREVLTRWVAFRSIVKVVLCCRPVDFCAFTACLTLLLAYLNSSKQASTMLTHQRQGDRALIETALETMDELNRLNGDELTRKTAELARKLLVLEAECAQGGQAYRSSVEDDEGVKDERTFYLKIPYFGTVKLACDDSSSQADTASSASSSQAPTWSSSSSSFSYESQLSQHMPGSTNGFPLPDLPVSYQGYETGMPDLMAGADTWAFQGVDSAIFNTIFDTSQITDEPWGGYMLSL
ncbi:fungal specific transcription factor domain-containing protein [Aspergillus mulundensis]|uniref:Transcription factor domain-containing protein n=1 Tax=Aspergillus mulundensis TaxID=1810919 RepID=A0A3D8RQQ5_9EURO|nr:hypothetical protein DSM5745_06292 [Aspergillus mulundensis]RDW76300.1 hypothetical protein DSM5745_06292 [Aspergillus mulundensis]